MLHDSLRQWAEANNCGLQERETIRLEWRGSSYMLHFLMGGRERHVNILPDIRWLIAGNFTKKRRELFEAAMPKTVGVHASTVEIYEQNRPYNYGGFRYTYDIETKGLKNWLQEAGIPLK